MALRNRNALLMAGALIITGLTAFYLGKLWISHYDYESCVDHAGVSAGTGEGLDLLLENCAAQYVGRRKSDGPGYEYREAKTGLSFDLAAANPTDSEWAFITSGVEKILIEKEMAVRAELAAREAVERDERRRAAEIEERIRTNVKWHDLKNWSKLRVGMSEGRVEQILGPAARKSFNKAGNYILFYEGIDANGYSISGGVGLSPSSRQITNLGWLSPPVR